MGAGISPYAYAFIFTQDEHERLLIETLRKSGVAIERQTEMTRFEESGDRAGDVRVAAVDPHDIVRGRDGGFVLYQTRRSQLSTNGTRGAVSRRSCPHLGRRARTRFTLRADVRHGGPSGCEHFNAG
jgi:hypothetical protein